MSGFYSGDADGDEGTFVWADSTTPPAGFVSTGPNQFLIRASGGVGIGTPTPSWPLHVETNVSLRSVFGLNTSTVGTSAGVFGQSNSSSGRGVTGWATATGGLTRGVFGESDSTSGRGVYGVALASSGSTFGVYGLSHSTSGTGVYGTSNATGGATFGVFGRSFSSSGTGVFGAAESTIGTNFGVRGETNSPDGFAGYFVGDVHVTGDFSVDGAKAFRIDHPLDPENKYLYHYALESPEVLNLYRGTVVLDAGGEGWADLPSYFHSINRDFTYQLTAVGAAMPNLHVAQEIDAARFKIAGGKAGMKVSWQLTAARNDPYVREYGAPVEAEKPETQRGFYQHPELYGQPEERGVEYRHRVEEQERHPESLRQPSSPGGDAPESNSFDDRDASEPAGLSDTGGAR